MNEMASDYYGRRADEQTALGNQASMPKVAVVHYELAYRYALLSSKAASSRHLGPGGA